jgi:uncharacterized protein YegL
MRRLPIYFLIDVSESMVGDPIQHVEEGMATIIQTLKSDPYAIETVWISIIVFAGKARTIVPLQEITTFYPPKFPIGSGTSLSNGLGHLMFELRKNTVKTTYERKGDWKPIVFLFTDGVPTEDSSAAVNEWKQSWHRATNLIAISFGSDTDTYLLSQLTENVLLFKNASADAYKQFFRWVTDSIKTSSESVENNSSGFEIANIDGQTLSKIDLTKEKNTKQYIDNNFIVLSAKCQNTKRPYLVKYRKYIKQSDLEEIEMNTLSYRLVGAFQVDQNYYELSDNKNKALTISTNELVGSPSCPCCGNQFGVAVCSCGQIHCIDDNEINICPNCGMQGRYGFGSEGFDINRTQG